MAQASDRVKRQAANIVLARLGEEMSDVVKYHLHRSYSISLEPNEQSKFSLDQLHFALSVLLGEGGANNLLNQVTHEIEELKRVQVS
jgi:hypothetical protein